MASGPQHGIEQELRAFARQRRKAAGDSIELHPATRKLLQDEVARLVAPAPLVPESSEPAPTRANWLAGFWLRFTFAGTGLCILVLAMIYWFPKEPEPQLQLAQSSTERAAASAPAIAEISPPQQPNPAGAPPVSDKFLALSASESRAEVLIDPISAFNQPARPAGQALPIEQQSPKVELARESNETFAEKKSQIAAVAADPQPVLLAEKPAVTPKAENLVLAKNATPAPQPITAAKPPVANVSPSRGAAVSDSQVDSTVTVWSLTSVNPRAGLRRNFNSPPLPRVLRSFRVETAGRTIRLIDEDGSTYEGSFDSNATPLSLASTPAVSASQLQYRGANPADGARKQSESLPTFTVRGRHLASKQEV
ncbi:MAG: hypothetical protein EXS31_09745, partial [Pedosphaera sp.]|nr:hypothetical protein [Pedosphaera sp.]